MHDGAMSFPRRQGLVYDPQLPAAERRLLATVMSRSDLHRLRNPQPTQHRRARPWLFAAAGVGVGALIALGLGGATAVTVTVFPFATVLLAAADLVVRGRGRRQDQPHVRRLRASFVEESALHPVDQRLLALTQNAVSAITDALPSAGVLLDCEAALMALREEEWRLAERLAELSELRSILGQDHRGRARRASPAEVASWFWRAEAAVVARIQNLREYASAVDAVAGGSQDGARPVVVGDASSMRRRLGDLIAQLSGDRIVDPIPDLVAGVRRAFDTDRGPGRSTAGPW